MTTSDFFADFCEHNYSEFVEAQLREIFQVTTPHEEFFEFDDVPQ